jgi:Carboxypeptidase regulatory-like domain
MGVLPGRLIGAGSIESVESIPLMAMIVLAGLATSHCSHDLSPTAPTSAPAVVGVPTPAPLNVTLKGRVTEAPPTTLTGIWDATVTLSDGTTSWSSTRTVGGDGRGVYVISGLHPGRYEAVASADGYVSDSRAITIAADTTTDFGLLPAPETLTQVFEYQISDRDGTCSDGTQLRPCRICAIPIHNPGPIDAILTWSAAGPVGLNVTLFQKGQLTPLGRSTAVDSTSQRLTMDLPGGALYELRITYVSGTGPASHRMRVRYQN